MKTLTLIFATLFTCSLAANPSNNFFDTTEVKLEKSDTTSITIGSRRVIIIDKDGKTDVTVIDHDKRVKNHTVPATSSSRPFSGRWKGLQLGFNNYVNSDFSTSLSGAEGFMEIHSPRSLNLNINILQYDLPFGRSNNKGFVTGLGFEYNNYRFSNDLTISKLDGAIVPVYYTDPAKNVNRTRFRTIYLTVPLLVEFQTNHAQINRRAYFSAGVIGGVNIGANTKVIYREGSKRQKDKNKGDFYLSPFRYGFTVNAGYRSLNLYATYYPTPLFQTNKGPELYPFQIGMTLLKF